MDSHSMMIYTMLYIHVEYMNTTSYVTLPVMLDIWGGMLRNSLYLTKVNDLGFSSNVTVTLGLYSMSENVVFGKCTCNSSTAIIQLHPAIPRALDGAQICSIRLPNGNIGHTQGKFSPLQRIHEDHIFSCEIIARLNSTISSYAFFLNVSFITWPLFGSRIPLRLILHDGVSEQCTSKLETYVLINAVRD